MYMNACRQVFVSMDLLCRKKMHISKSLRVVNGVVNGDCVAGSGMYGGRQRTRTEELGTSRSHFELLTVSSRLLDISTTRLLDHSTNTKPRFKQG